MWERGEEPAIIARFVGIAAAVLISWSVSWQARAAGPIVVLKSKSLEAYNEAERGVRAVLGSRVATFDLRGDLTSGQSLAERIDKKHPSAIVAIGAKAAKIASTFLSKSPLIYCLVMRPRRFGLDRARTYGIPMGIPTEARLALLKQLALPLRSLAVLVSPRIARHQVRSIERAAAKAKITVALARASHAKQVPRVLEKLLPGADALWLLPDPAVITATSLRFILLQGFRKRIPILGFSRQLVREGALLAVMPDYRAMGRAAADLALQLTAGAAPVKVPRVAPKLAINATTARRLGMSVPKHLADNAEIFR